MSAENIYQASQGDVPYLKDHLMYILGQGIGKSTLERDMLLGNYMDSQNPFTIESYPLGANWLIGSIYVQEIAAREKVSIDYIYDMMPDARSFDLEQMLGMLEGGMPAEKKGGRSIKHSINDNILPIENPVGAYRQSIIGRELTFLEERVLGMFMYHTKKVFQKTSDGRTKDITFLPEHAICYEHGLIRHNLLLPFNYAVKFLRNTRDAREHIQDFAQIGSASLVEKTKEFDPYRMTRYSTFAHWWILKSFMSEGLDMISARKISKGFRETVKKINREINVLEQREGRHATAYDVERIVTENDLAGKTNPRDIVQRFYGAFIPDYSLDAPNPALDSGSSLSDSIPDTSSDIHSYIEPILFREFWEKVASSNLKAREQRVLEMRYGLNRSHPGGMTMDLVGRKMGVSRERVRQIEEAALKKVRPIFEAYGTGANAFI